MRLGLLERLMTLSSPNVWPVKSMSLLTPRNFSLALVGLGAGRPNPLGLQLHLA